MALDEKTRNNLVAQMSGEFLRSFAVHDSVEPLDFESSEFRTRVTHVAFALAEDYCNVLELHLGAGNNGSH